MKLFNTDTHRLIRDWLPVRPLRWLFWTGTWIAIGLLSALHWYLFFQGGIPQGIYKLLIGKVLVFVIWGGLTNIILWLAWRFPLNRQLYFRNILILIAGSLIICTSYCFLYSLTLTYLLVSHFSLSFFWENLEFVVSQHSSWYYLMFWATVVAEYLARNHHEALRRQETLAEAERQMALLRLSMLKSRLQPHFFFNSLNLISAQIANGKQEQAQQTLIELSELLRKSLRTSRTSSTTLGEEIDFCRRYLTLLSYRFRDRLRVQYDIAPEVMDAQVPSLILQPIVENAVKHGVSANRGAAEIQIRCHHSGDRLLLNVVNRGKLPAGETESESSSGIGLSATKDRLRLLFEADYYFSAGRIQSDEFGVEMSIPLKHYSHSRIDDAD